MSSLTELIEQQSCLIQQICENHGEVTPEFESELEALGAALIQKVDGYKDFVDRLDAEVAFFRERADFFSRAARSVKRTRDFLWDRLKDYVMTTPNKEVIGDLYKYKLSRTKAKLVIDDKCNPAALADSEHENLVKMEFVLDKSKVREVLESGDALPFARLEDMFALKTSANSAKSTSKKGKGKGNGNNRSRKK